LGSLEDKTALPLLLARLSDETDCGLRVAYASALGKLGAQQAIGDMLPTLRASQDSSTRMELGLALARLVGDEHYFVQLLRQAGAETGTVVSQAVTALTKKMRQLYSESESESEPEDNELIQLMEDCAEALARQQLERGVALLGCVIGLLPLEELDASCRVILQECAERIDEFGVQRIEYVILTLHTMNVLGTL
jgi:HEAT repeat protein